MLKFTGSDFVNEITRKCPRAGDRYHNGGYLVVQGFGVIFRNGDGETLAGFGLTEQEAEKLVSGFQEGDKAKEMANAVPKKKAKPAARSA